MSQVRRHRQCDPLEPADVTVIAYGAADQPADYRAEILEEPD
jgi:hypothetical protein